MGDLLHEDVPEAWIDRVFAVMALCPHHIFQVLTKRADRMRNYLTKEKNPNGHHSAMDYAALMAATGCYNTPSLDLRVWPLPNLCLGVSAEDQVRAEAHIPDLLATPAALRFVSAEPLLGPLRLDDLIVEGGKSGEGHVNCLNNEGIHGDDDSTFRGATIDWVIRGGAGGRPHGSHGARPARPVRDPTGRSRCLDPTGSVPGRATNP